jgi:hypothetical protein
MRLFITLMVAIWFSCAGAGTATGRHFDATTLAPAFPGSVQAQDAALVIEVQRKLPPQLSVVSNGHFVVAAPGSARDADRQGRRLTAYEAQLRQASFPDLEIRRMTVIVAENNAELHRIAGSLYPALSRSELPASGFYHEKERLILTTTEKGDGALLSLLMLALMKDHNPRAPAWFEQAAAMLYASSEWRSGRLTPMLDQSIEQIPPGEDLSFDVFAGICDCSPVSSEQLALMRLLLIFLHQRDELMALHTAIKAQGQYTTLLQALDAMAFDKSAWKDFAERSVRSYPR